MKGIFRKALAEESRTRDLIKDCKTASGGPEPGISMKKISLMPLLVLLGTLLTVAGFQGTCTAGDAEPPAMAAQAAKVERVNVRQISHDLEKLIKTDGTGVQ